jgi:hypothetical protein
MQVLMIVLVLMLVLKFVGPGPGAFAGAGARARTGLCHSDDYDSACILLIFLISGWCCRC